MDFLSPLITTAGVEAEVAIMQQHHGEAMKEMKRRRRRRRRARRPARSIAKARRRRHAQTDGSTAFNFGDFDTGLLLDRHLGALIMPMHASGNAGGLSNLWPKQSARRKAPNRPRSTLARTRTPRQPICSKFCVTLHLNQADCLQLDGRPAKSERSFSDVMVKFAAGDDVVEFCWHINWNYESKGLVLEAKTLLLSLAFYRKSGNRSNPVDP